MMKYNTNLKNLKESKLSIFQNEISKIKDITLLTYGESDYPIDPMIKTEMIHFLIEDKGKYQPHKGLEKLRNAITLKENQKHHSNYSSNNVLITAGATEGLFLALSSLINKNDEVLLIKPCYPTYEYILNYLGAKITYVDYDKNFEVDLIDLKKKIHSKIKVIIFNYPNNPSGSILSEDKVITIKDLILKYKVPFILDNVYDEIVYSKYLYLDDFNELDDYRIIINSLSKSKRLSGFRLGYIIGPETLINLCSKLHQEINICLPQFMMEGMIYALTSNPEVEYYKKNIAFIIKQLNKMKVPYIIPKGTFYICINISNTKMNDEEFCYYLANKYKIGLIPCSYFKMDGYARICAANSIEKLNTALKQLKKALKDIKAL